MTFVNTFRQLFKITLFPFFYLRSCQRFWCFKRVFIVSVKIEILYGGGRGVEFLLEGFMQGGWYLPIFLLKNLSGWAFIV